MNPYPFIYLEPEKGTPFGRSLPVQAIIGSTPPGYYVVRFVETYNFVFLLAGVFGSFHFIPPCYLPLLQLLLSVNLTFVENFSQHWNESGKHYPSDESISLDSSIGLQWNGTFSTSFPGSFPWLGGQRKDPGNEVGYFFSG